MTFYESFGVKEPKLMESNKPCLPGKPWMYIAGKNPVAMCVNGVGAPQCLSNIYTLSIYKNT